MSLLKQEAHSNALVLLNRVKYKILLPGKISRDAMRLALQQPLCIHAPIHRLSPERVGQQFS